MQVAYINTSCHCDEEGLESFTWEREDGVVRLALPNEEPILRVHCGCCGGARRVRVAVALDHAPNEPIAEHELLELLDEFESVGEQIREEETMRSFVSSALMERRDELRPVAELFDLESEIDAHERNGILVMPSALGRREELRAMVRELLSAAA